MTVFLNQFHHKFGVCYELKYYFLSILGGGFSVVMLGLVRYSRFLLLFVYWTYRNWL